MGWGKPTSDKALLGAEQLKMMPSVRVGRAPDVTAGDAAASQPFHKVGLGFWEP